MRRITWVILPVGAVVVASLSAQAAQASGPPQTAPLDAYAQLRGLEDVGLSPSGERMAISAILDGKRKIIIYGNGDKVLQTIDAQNINLSSLQFAGENNLLVYSYDTVKVPESLAGQYKLSQATVLPVKPSSKSWTVFGNRPDLAPVVLGGYGLRQLADGWHAYFGGIEYISDQAGAGAYLWKSGAATLFDVDLVSGTAQKLAGQAGPDSVRNWLVSSKGSVAATLEKSMQTGKWIIKNGTGHIIASGSTKRGSTFLIGFGPDPGTLVYGNTDQKTGINHWYEIPLAGGATTPFLEKVGLGYLFKDPDSGKVVGYKEDKPEAKPVFFDPHRQQIVDMIKTAFAGKNPVIYGWSSNMGHVNVHIDGNHDSGTWYKVNLKTLRANLFGLDRPLIKPDMVGPVSLVRYAARDGTRLDGVLTLPPGREAKNLPVLVLPHDGPHEESEVIFSWLAQAFASRGYAVFQPNYRGSTGNGTDLVIAGYGQWGRKMQTDISDGIAYLAAQGIVNPHRACIMGNGYGGYAALAGVTLQHGLYRCAVSVGGISDVSLAFHRIYKTSGYTRLTKVNLDVELGPRSGWNAISPRDHAAAADAPILLIAGENDTAVPIDQSKEMAAALSKAGKPYKFIDLGPADHWLSRASSRQKMLEAAMAWVQKYNPAD